ncbi:HNH endonuclease signature motif containing protein [Ligilactobacillus salivarius]|uniref:HNH endonuclease signature motif containing protein n=1 Tax=Ligilactobacillus salivarius TaxID=1624 RepID=UPI000BAFBFB1|nr:HNH endonuclease signature motif containing protein [Ligilactobacillus salivarius]PAY37393.1 hypothetical protein A8C54_04670 [Ligilactobacillus salivarius]PAY42203.1 hypothetical protein A8C34_03645 [Ligilactobacillus salivarius]
MSRKLSPKIINWLEVNVPGKPWIESFELFKQEFPDFPWTLDNMKMACYRRNIHNGISGKFKKGNKAWNKGMKGLRFPGSEKGWFKKGQKSLNEKPLGSEYKCDGYTMVKVKETGTRYERWRLKHVLIWEEHNGPVPKDSVVTFLDGNRDNFDINNLACVRKGVNSVLNTKKLRSQNKEIFEARVAQIELDQKIKRITKNLGSD